MKRLQSKGFTLGELLVVVAIIGILVAVSIPIFSGQTEKAKAATDAANERSAKSAATVAYLTDEKYGVFFYDAASGTLKTTYTDISAYGKAKEHINKIVRCTLSNTGDLTTDWTIGGIDYTVDLGEYKGVSQTTLSMLFNEVTSVSSLNLKDKQRYDSNATTGIRAPKIIAYLATTKFSTTNVKTWAIRKLNNYVSTYVTDVDVNTVTPNKDQIRTMKYYYDSVSKKYKYSIGYTIATHTVDSSTGLVYEPYAAIDDTKYDEKQSFDNYTDAVKEYNKLQQIK